MHLQPGEFLLVSSEDVRCFFYTLRVPEAWWKYLCFGKKVPDVCLPSSLVGQSVYLASTVLPIKFLNSVSLAQHVHRNLALLSGREHGSVNAPENELRKDAPFTVGEPRWRVYLDNYDLIERVEATLCGTNMRCGLCLAISEKRWRDRRWLKCKEPWWMGLVVWPTLVKRSWPSMSVWAIS